MMKPLLFALIGFSVLAQTGNRPWSDIAGPARAKVPPAPPLKVQWRTDLAAAMKEARKQKKPLFVAWRCLPCKQCADFDKTVL
jgi:serine protease Do